MAIRITAAAIGLSTLALVALFVWGGLRGSAPFRPGLGEGEPAAALSEKLPEGLIEAQVYVSGELAYRIDIRFSPEPTSPIPSSMPPDVTISMTDMHMDGFAPPLEPVGEGVWRAQGRMPMAGRWIMSVGYGEELAEVVFSAD